MEPGGIARGAHAEEGSSESPCRTEEAVDGVRLTGLWKNEGQDGKPYLAGSLGGGRMMVFPNERKTKEQDPDFVVYLVPAEKKENGGGARGGRGRQADSGYSDGGRFDRGDPFGGR